MSLETNRESAGNIIWENVYFGLRQTHSHPKINEDSPHPTPPRPRTCRTVWLNMARAFVIHSYIWITLTLFAYCPILHFPVVRTHFGGAPVCVVLQIRAIVKGLSLVLEGKHAAGVFVQYLGSLFTWWPRDYGSCGRSAGVRVRHSTSLPGSFISRRPGYDRAWERGCLSFCFVCKITPQRLVLQLTLSLLRSKVHYPNLLVRNGTMMIFQSAESYKKLSSSYCVMWLLVRLQEKFELEHSWNKATLHPNLNASL